MADKLEIIEPDAAFAYYYQGLVLSRMGRGEGALTRFKKALVAELRRDIPDGMNLRLFRDKIREAEAGLSAPRSRPQSLSPPPP